MTARLIFPDGKIFYGKVFAKGESCTAEVVFNTAMVGYQEVLTDPSYRGQMVVMTYPMIGNYGINEEDVESKEIHVKALLVKEYIDFPSNWRSTQTLKQYLETHNIMGVEGFDTRAITKYLRQFGAAKAILTTSNLPVEELIADLDAANLVSDLVAEVSSATVYQHISLQKKALKVAVIDGGVKQNILRILADFGCSYTVFPYDVAAHEILLQNFDGVLLSNGPGDPRNLTHLAKTVKQLVGKLPIFGICLGHQILGLALGAKIEKLKFGHHGINHPIKNLQTQAVEITSQNHNYVIAPNSFNEEKVVITHINLLDNTIAGIRHTEYPAFSVQYHPESAPGPLDSRYLFEEFVGMMEAFKTNQKQKGKYLKKEMMVLV
ncbi:MAG: glutamine-hydrolyzing carbamoyl-phosphate synthase small subunit [Chitinophagales bacterium]